MNKTLKIFIYLSSIAWVVYTLTTLSNTIEAQINGIITAVVSLMNMVVNDLNK